MCANSLEEHLQPFKDKMEAFVVTGESKKQTGNEIWILGSLCWLLPRRLGGGKGRGEEVDMSCFGLSGVQEGLGMDGGVEKCGVSPKTSLQPLLGAV